MPSVREMTSIGVPTLRSVRTVFAALLTAGAVLAPAAASGQSASTQVVVRAVGGDGQPVLDLKPADLTLRLDGREREVKSLRLVQPTAGGAVGAAAAAPVSALPPPYTTNAGGTTVPQGAREFIIAIDDEGIAPGREQPVRDAVKALLASLSPVDAVGLAGLKSGGVRLAPTTSHAAVVEGLARISALGSTSESATDMACRTRTVLASVSALIQDAPVSRNIVVFSPGIAPPTGETMRTQLGNPTDSQASMCQFHQRDLEALGRTAAASPAAVYVAYLPEALANPANRTVGEAGLDHLAGVTGGEMIRVLGTTAAVDRIGRTAGTYYLAELDQPIAGVRRMEARVAREGVRVSARPAGTAAAVAAKAPAARDMVRSPTGYRDLAVRAAAFVSRQPGSADMKIVALLEPEEPQVKLSAAVVGIFDQSGTLKAQWTAQTAELAKSPVTAALTIAPGTYRLRVAAVDQGGKGGTTDVELHARLTDAAPVQLGTMVLGANQGGFVPKLAFTSADSAAIGLFEVYGLARDAKLDVTFELARQEQGEPMGTGAATIANGPGEDARIVYGGFPLAALEPGDYILRAIVKVDGKPAGIARRTIRKLK